MATRASARQRPIGLLFSAVFDEWISEEGQEEQQRRNERRQEMVVLVYWIYAIEHFPSVVQSDWFHPDRTRSSRRGSVVREHSAAATLIRPIDHSDILKRTKRFHRTADLGRPLLPEWSSDCG